MCAAVKANWSQTVEILDLRHFSSSDLRPVLEEESARWDKELFWDYTQSAEMILRYVDARILPGYAAVERGRIFGYAFFVYEGGKGVIGDLYVRAAGARGRSASDRRVEAQLLTHVIETLQRSPGIHRIESQLLLHTSGEVTPSFAEQGFRQYPRLFMTLPLSGGSTQDGGAKSRGVTALSEGIVIRRWSENDYQQAATLITSCYQGHIDSEINDQYRTVAGSLRFLNNIVRFPGCGVFEPLSSYVGVHKLSGRLIGLILCSQVKNRVGHITQVCVLPEFRRRGIGEALLAANAGELRRRGFEQLSLTVSEANAGAVDVYRRLGYATNRVFDAFVWEG